MRQTVSYVAEIRGDVCQCGSAKKRGKPLCGRCFWSLPDRVRFGLLRRIGRGYESARERARVILDRAAAEETAGD